MIFSMFFLFFCFIFFFKQGNKDMECIVSIHQEFAVKRLEEKYLEVKEKSDGDIIEFSRKDRRFKKGR